MGDDEPFTLDTKDGTPKLIVDFRQQMEHRPQPLFWVIPTVFSGAATIASPLWVLAEAPIVSVACSVVGLISFVTAGVFYGRERRAHP